MTETGSQSGVDLAVLRDLAVDIATEAGQFLLDAVHDVRTTVETKSTGTDMVTEMDRASEALLVERIRAARPDDTILGEEGTDHSGNSPVRWVIDPLDGTTNYLYRLPGWNVSIGIEIAGEPVAGAVVLPASGDTFAAAAGHGATCNDRRLVAVDPPPLAEMLVGTGFAYDPAVRARQGAAVATLLPQVRDIRRVGAAAGDLCAVAAGRLDAYFESGLGPWDRCAGTVIAREAGYRVDVIENHANPGILVIATHPAAWDEFCGLLSTIGAREVPFHNLASSTTVHEAR